MQTNSRSLKIVSALSLIAVLLVSYQNFTTAQISEFEAAKAKLENIEIPSLYDYCAVAGTAADKRPKSIQFKCNELPFGKIIGINQATYESILAANPVVEIPTSCYGRGMLLQQIANCKKLKEAAQVRQNAQKELALWNSKKELINKNIDYRDRAGNSRSVKFAAYIDRSAIETSTDVVLGNSDIGIKNYGIQRIYKPQGHHFYSLNKDNYTLSTCTYFPGMRIYGESMSAKYTIFDYWWGRYSVDFSINPGSFKFDRFETCNLLRVNTAGDQNNLISLIGVKSPKFAGAQLSGLAFDIDIGIFGWFVTTILAAVLSFIPLIGPLLSAALISSVFIVTETNVPAQIAQTYLNQSIESYDSADAWNRILNNFNSSEANIKSGGYLKDLTTISLLKNSVLPALKEQMAIHSKIELLRKLDPSAAAAIEKAQNDILELKRKADQIEADARALRDKIDAQIKQEQIRFNNFKRRIAIEP